MRDDDLPVARLAHLQEIQAAANAHAERSHEVFRIVGAAQVGFVQGQNGPAFVMDDAVPQIEVAALLKITGSLGRFMPASAAWSE